MFWLACWGLLSGVLVLLEFPNKGSDLPLRNSNYCVPSAVFSRVNQRQCDSSSSVLKGFWLKSLVGIEVKINLAGFGLNLKQGPFLLYGVLGELD